MGVVKFTFAFCFTFDPSRDMLTYVIQLLKAWETSSTHCEVLEGPVEDAHIEVEPVVDEGPGLDVGLGIEVVLPGPGVLLGDVGGDWPALVEHEVAVRHHGHAVLRVQLRREKSYYGITFCFL